MSNHHEEEYPCGCEYLNGEHIKVCVDHHNWNPRPGVAISDIHGPTDFDVIDARARATAAERERDEAHLVFLAYVLLSVALLEDANKWGQETVCRTVNERDAARVAIANVSGALVDSGVVVPDDEARYGEAVREIVRERDEARAHLHIAGKRADAAERREDAARGALSGLRTALIGLDATARAVYEEDDAFTVNSDDKIERDQALGIALDRSREVIELSVAPAQPTPGPGIASIIGQLREIVTDQANDPGLWFDADRAPEAYLQRALRDLHGVVERAIEGLTEDAQSATAAKEEE